MMSLLDEDGETPIKTDDHEAFAKQFGSIRQLGVNDPVGGIAVSISTVFLGIDHAYDGGAPVLWETMVFQETGEQHADEGACLRYCSHAQAVAGHAEMIRAVIARWPRPEFIQDLREQFDVETTQETPADLGWRYPLESHGRVQERFRQLGHAQVHGQCPGRCAEEHSRENQPSLRTSTGGHDADADQS